MKHDLELFPFVKVKPRKPWLHRKKKRLAEKIEQSDWILNNQLLCYLINTTGKVYLLLKHK
jgi:hypothetical protein